MLDASPLRCAGERDLGLSVSAWPKLASKGSQRLVSVGRAQAAAAMVLSAALWLVLCTRADLECRAALVGWLIFAEFPDFWTWLGGTIIFVASIWLTRQGRKK